VARLQLSITALNETGYGVGQKAGQTLTVARTAPGDQVLVSKPQSADRWSRADLLQVVHPGPDRVTPPCPAFSQGCGGCQWQHLSYPAQAAWKQKNLSHLLRSQAGYKGELHPLVLATALQGYRNKLSLKNALGKLVFVPEFDGSTLAPSECAVQTPALQAAWAALQGIRVPMVIEQLHLRSNAAGQVGLHAFVREEKGVDAALRQLWAACGWAHGLGATSRKGYRAVAGEPVLAQTLGRITWLLPHNGFFQTNAVMADALLALVTREAKAGRTNRLLDLYCGAGFFGLALADLAHEVVGIEEHPQSVAAAEASARHSGLTNTRFLAGDLGAVLATLEKPALATNSAEIAVVDPPREGLLPRAVEALVARAPQRVVYVSCHAPSLARDYKLLAKAGYRGVSCTAVDLFPHTSHLETVMTLER